MKLILNADDFGYSRGINFGIVDAFNMGILTSTTLMMNMPGTQHAIDLWKQYPNMAVGLHLNFSLGQPLTKGLSLTKEDGDMIKPDLLSPEHVYIEKQIKDEIKAQFDAFVTKTGRTPDHIDSHLFSTDKVSQIKKVAIEFAQKNNLPLRNHDINEFKHVTFINHRNYNSTPNLNYIIDNFDSISEYEFVEIMTHPGYIDQYLMDNSSYNIQRAGELKFLLDKTTKDFFETKGVTLSNYQQIQK